MKKKGIIAIASTLTLAGVAAVTSIGVAVGTNKKNTMDNTGEPSINQTLYSVTFNTNGGTMTDSEQQVTGGNTLTAPTVTRSGYDFLGWYTDEACTQRFDFNATPISSNITLYAKWGMACTVTFDTCDGNAVTTVKVVEGSKVSAPAEPHRNNYEFGGWYLDDEYQAEYDFDTMVNNNLTLFAKWNEIYSVLFNTDGGSDVTAQQVVNGNLATAPMETPTRGKDVFLGWYVNGEEFDFANPITKNTVITAKWVKDITELCDYEEVYDDESNLIGYKVTGFTGTYEDIILPSEHNGLPVVSISAYVYDYDPPSHSTTMKSIIIPDSYTEIGEFAFRDCAYLTSITIPDSVTRIASGAFEGCSSLTSITIPNSVKYIGIESFRDCGELISVVLTNGIEVIENWSFEYCYKLKSITIPASVTHIYNNAFEGCYNLQTIYFEAESKPSGWNDGGVQSDANVLWAGQWHYDENGNPVANE